jgi:hypothetical protein
MYVQDRMREHARFFFSQDHTHEDEEPSHEFGFILYTRGEIKTPSWEYTHVVL